MEDNMEDFELEMQEVDGIRIPYEKVADLELPLTLKNIEGEDVEFDEDSLKYFKEQALYNIKQAAIDKEANDKMLIVVAKKKEFEAKALIVSNKVQQKLDTVAKRKGWDSMQSARACAGIPLNGDETDIEKSIHADAVSLSRWYLQVWAKVYEIQNAVKAGDMPEVSASEVIPMLPKHK